MVFAYEPEAAALFTQYDFLHSEECFTQFCYLVVDCGGGTVDIAAHRITKQHGNIVINDIAPPHGGNCGGFAVNDQFEKLLLDILKISPEKFQQLKINCAVQWNTLMNETFEENKTTIDPKDNFSSITLNVPLMIYNEIKNIAGKSLEELIGDYGDENIEWDEDESAIILNYSVIDKLFEPVLDEICKLIKAVLAKNECNEVKTILLVGGFAESPYLFQRIEDTFGKEYNVNRSTTPAFSVVKGAVLCGQQERLIKPLLEKIKDQSTTLKPESSPPQNDVYTDIQPDDTQLESQHTASVSQSPTLQTEQTLSPPMQQVKSPMQTVKYLPPAITKQLPPLENMPDQPPSQNNESTNTQSVFGSPQPIESPKQIVKHLPPAFTKHLPLVLSRKMKHTVGVETVEEFQNGHHNVNKMVLIDKEQYCEDVFFTLVRANESVKVGSPKRVYKFVPATEKQSICIINIFASNQEDVKYIDDEGCQHRAKVEINIPHDASESREIELCVNFYNTEVEIEVYSVNNKEVKKIPVDYEFFHAQP